ncbi:MAG: outer membrane lipoprotein-sorting protein [Lentisphaerae bacterium]|nr:outer membrane lipoprotein-sorting protein [Lentisphaerota bacterium]
MKPMALLLASGLLLGAGVKAPAADETDANTIVERANKASYYAGKDGRAQVKMTLSDGRTREFVILRANADEGMEQKFYVYFMAPADVRKMAYLVHKRPGGLDDRWLFLPALNLVKRIAPGDKRTSFVGSDFLYEDVSGRGLEEDTHELIESSATQYVLKNTPKDSGSVKFLSYTVWIDKETFLPRKAEYLDKNGTLYRRVVATKVETIEGHPTVLETYAEDLVSGSKTVNSFSEVSYDLGLKDGLFTERFLRRPPREVTR